MLALLVAGLVAVFVSAGLRQDDKTRMRERAALLASLRAREAVMEQALATAEDDRTTLQHLVQGDVAAVHHRFGQRLNDGFGFEFVYITDARGKVIYSSERGQLDDRRAFDWIRPAIERALADGQHAARAGIVATRNAAGLLVARPFEEKTEDLSVAQPLVAVTVDVIDPEFLRTLGRPASVEDVELIQQPHAGPPLKGVFVPNLYDGSEAELVWRGAEPGRNLLKGLMPAAAVLATLLAAVLLILLVRTSRIAAALADSEARTREAASRDYLTSLLNRGAFIEALDAAVARPGSGNVALLFVDLDDFKQINDASGHAAGDDLLRAVARRLEAAMGSEGVAARFGGDEFVAFFRFTDADDLESALARLREQLAPPVLLEQGGEVVGTVSIGVARLPQDATTPSELMRLADVALYRAKSEGAGLCRLFDPAFELERAGRRRIETELTGALDRGEITLVYQPQVDVESERVVGFEALMRWDHPVRGRLLPAEFIAVAESSRLIGRLDAHVLRMACADGMSLPGVTLSVNMSALNLRNGAICDMVTEALAETGFDPRRLEIEITESAILDTAEDGEAALTRLRDMGVRIALDDFGTGHASLVHVRRFPVTKIKIDKSFILNLGEHREAAAIVEYVVRLGRSLGITLTAEGVETREQLRFLRAFGAQQAQGYLFAPPLPLAAAAALLERQAAETDALRGDTGAVRKARRGERLASAEGPDGAAPEATRQLAE